MKNRKVVKTALALFILGISIPGSTANAQPNFMIIITDDMGTDAFAPYGIGTDQASTPNLEALMNEGLRFNNAYAYSTCAPSRASIMTGRYGNKSGLTRSGPNLENSEVTIFEYIDALTSGAYSNALFGKWHLGASNPERPNLQGIHHYDGNLHSGVSDYYEWERTKNGVVDTSREYVTTYITNEAIDWLDTVSTPFLLWMAYNAPHSPFHLPPDSLYTRTATSSSEDRYFCMIESVDHEFGRLYDAMSRGQRDSTVFIFIGDNGTPNGVIQGYPSGHGKGTLYEGGIRVPMFISGYGVERAGEQENGLVAVVDVFATILEYLGEDLPGGYDNSFSLRDVLANPDAETRTYNYSEQSNDEEFSRAIRNDQYKLIIRESLTGSEFEFYDLLADPFETTELLAGGITADQQRILDELQAEADSIFLSWSCNDKIQNGSEEGIDCGGESCTPCITTGVDRFSESQESLIYMNPTNGLMTVNVEPGRYNLTIYSLDGQRVLRKNIDGVSHVNIDHLASSVYFVRLRDTKTNEVCHTKVTKH